MNDRREIDEDNRDWLDVRRNPRGNRLTIQPMNANNLGRDYRPLPGLPPVNPPPIRATAKEIAEDESGIADRSFRRTRNAMFSSRD